MRVHIAGFSLIEAIVALALTASVSAALLPAIALAARLHRDSAIETDAVIVASARLARLSADVSSGVIDAGAGVETGGPSFEVRWQAAPAAGAPGVFLLSVRVIPLANRGAAVTLTVAVPDG